MQRPSGGQDPAGPALLISYARVDAAATVRAVPTRLYILFMTRSEMVVGCCSSLKSQMILQKEKDDELEHNPHVEPSHARTHQVQGTPINQSIEFVETALLERKKIHLSKLICHRTASLSPRQVAGHNHNSTTKILQQVPGRPSCDANYASLSQCTLLWYSYQN